MPYATRIQRCINGKSYELVPPRSHKKLVAPYKTSNSSSLDRGLRKTILCRGMISAREQEQSCDALFSLASCCTTAAIPEPWEQLPALLLLPATPRFHFHPGPGRACPCWTSRTLCSGLASTGQAAGEPAGPQQRSSSEDRSRYVFFFCSLHNFFFQEDLSTPPSHPDFPRGTAGNPPAAEPHIQGSLSPTDLEAEYTCPAPSIARWCLGEQSPACTRFTAVISLAAGADSRLRLAASASLAGGRNASPLRQAAGTG